MSSNVDLGELEVFVRNVLRIQLDDDNIGRGQLIDLYDYLIIGLEPDEEFEKTLVIGAWAGTMSALFEEAENNAEAARRHWGGQLGIDLKGSGARTTDGDVKNAMRSDSHWVTLCNEEARYKKYKNIFTRLSMLLYKKVDALSSRGGMKSRFEYADVGRREKMDNVEDTIKKGKKKKKKKKPKKKREPVKEE